jgi:hypothetical protein
MIKGGNWRPIRPYPVLIENVSPTMGEIASTSASSRGPLPRGRPRFLFIYGLSLLGLGPVWTLRGEILAAAGRTWVTSDQFGPADAAAVLGGGIETRPVAAAQLFKAGPIK